MNVDTSICLYPGAVSSLVGECKCVERFFVQATVSGARSFVYAYHSFPVMW